MANSLNVNTNGSGPLVGGSKPSSPAWTPERKREWERENYKNSSARRANVKAARERPKAEWRAFMTEFFEAGECLDCGIADSRVFEFDHVRGEKSFNIGGSWFRSLDVVKSEIEKCELVCANCHRIRTFRRSNSYRHGK